MPLCARCSKPGANEKRRDPKAGMQVRWFHKNCVLDFAWWLSGHVGPRTQRCQNARCSKCNPVQRTA